MRSVATTAKQTALDPRDFLAIDALLDDEEKAIRDTVRQFVRERIVPEVGEWFEQGILPRELAQEIGRLGLFGMHLDGYGLPGASAVSYGLTCLELEAGDSGIRSFVSVQGSLAMFAIWRWGSEEQKQRWLPPMHTGEAIGCFGLTEPDAGSDPGSMRTQARRDGADWVLNGTKMWITNGTIADVAVVWARTDDGSINGFIVEKDMPGFTAPEMHHKLSLRASVTSELVLRDVRVPEENRFPEIASLRGPLSCLNEARYGIVWGAVGAGRACFEAALDYAKERIVFEKPVAGYQLTQQKLAEMALEINRGTLVALHIGRMKDEGTLRPEHVSLGKMGNVRGALEVCRSARTILGANGVTLEYPVIRHMNNLESVLDVRGDARGAHARRRPGADRGERIPLDPRIEALFTEGRNFVHLATVLPDGCRRTRFRSGRSSRTGGSRSSRSRRRGRRGTSPPTRASRSRSSTATTRTGTRSCAAASSRPSKARPRSRSSTGSRSTTSGLRSRCGAAPCTGSSPSGRTSPSFRSSTDGHDPGSDPGACPRRTTRRPSSRRSRGVRRRRRRSPAR